MTNFLPGIAHSKSVMLDSCYSLPDIDRGYFDIFTVSRII